VGLVSHIAENPSKIKAKLASRGVQWMIPQPMQRFTANADYQETDSRPIRLEVGDEVTAGPPDRAWPGWIWAADVHGNHGYVPEDWLETLDDGRFRVSQAFDPTVLTVRRGDRLDSLQQIHGWHWCRNDAGAEGWVAGYLLRPQ
jgi:hypothetical protein